MNLQYRIGLLTKLGKYILSGDDKWIDAKTKATAENGWFIPEFVDLAAQSIAVNFLEREILENWAAGYAIPATQPEPKTVGIVMAGNIPLVGFHDLLCVFVSGHKAMVKASTKDHALVNHLVMKLTEWDERVSGFIEFASMLKNCDAYIATGSNNTAGYFEYYFKKYPHIIRRNRTSVAILAGNETPRELSALADDVYQYFGLGCRNVTKIYVPEGYDFVPLLRAFERYNWLAENHKYKNNYDYNLALHILNNRPYMSNASIILVEDPSHFSPVSQLHYQYYTDVDKIIASLENDPGVQCLAGHSLLPFGQAQQPAINQYADGVDTMQFLAGL